MLKCLRLSLHIDITIFVNSFIYFLKRIPLVKKIVRNVKYEHYSTTGGFATLTIIYTILKTLIKTLLLVGIGILFPLFYSQINGNTKDVAATFYYVFLLLFILLPACNTKVLEQSRRKLICVKVMKMEAKQYILADLFPKDICKLLLEIPVYYFISRYFDLNVFVVLLLVLSKHLSAIFFETLQVHFYEKTGIILARKYVYVLIYFAIILFLAYFFVLNNKVQVLPIPEIVMIIIAVISILLGTYGIYYLMNYDHYSSAINASSLFSDFNVDRVAVSAEANFRAVKMKEKDFDTSELYSDKFEKYKGYDYLNAIFRRRHRRVLYRPIRIQLIIIAIVLLTLIICMLNSSDMKEMYVPVMLKRFPYIIFVLYVMSTGVNATKAMFYNCDHCLLHYSFYRERKTLLQTFTIRLKDLVFTNFLPAAFMAVSFLLLALISGDGILDILPISLLTVIISMFFSVHHLFLYYIFQPYTTDLTMKNPFFSILNFILYALCFTCVQIDSAPENFLLFTMIGTVAYMIIALILVYKLADKTFRLR